MPGSANVFETTLTGTQLITNTNLCFCSFRSLGFCSSLQYFKFACFAYVQVYHQLGANLLSSLGTTKQIESLKLVVSSPNYASLSLPEAQSSLLNMFKLGFVQQLRRCNVYTQMLVLTKAIATWNWTCFWANIAFRLQWEHALALYA